MELLAALLGVSALVVVAVVVVGLYLSRQGALSRRVGSFPCGLRGEASEESWSSGVAQYASGRLLWWRVISLAPRPAHVWSRDQLTLLERVPLEERDERGRPMLQVHCRHGAESFQLQMSVSACAGLVSWLESGPRPLGG